MPGQNILIWIIGLPLLGAFFLPFAGRISALLRNVLAVALALSCCFFSFKLAPLVISGQGVTFSREFLLGANLIFHADGLAVFMAVISSLVSSIILIFSFGYISHYRNQNEYYFLVVLFLGAMMGIVFSANLLFLYVFWEITAVVSWRLIAFFRKDTDLVRADKAFLVTVFGALIMLIGFIMIYQQSGSFDIAVIKQRLGPAGISNLAVLLIMAGILSKSATLPFHTWLPDAGVAPAPVTALLHAAVLVKIGVYVYARLFVASFTPALLWNQLLPWIAALSSAISAGAALRETDFKRIVAYSTISQIGFIFLGLTIGNNTGFAGGLLYILMHGIAKAGLFLCAGIVEQNTGIRDITKLGGLIRTMPLTALAFLFCAFSVMGIPPTGGFFAKYLVIAGSLQAGRMGLSFVFLAIACMTLLYLFRLFYLVFLQEGSSPAPEGSRGMVFSVLLLAFISLAAGIAVQIPMNYIQAIILQLKGVI